MERILRQHLMLTDVPNKGLHPTALIVPQIGGSTRLQLVLWRKFLHASAQRVKPDR